MAKRAIRAAEKQTSFIQPHGPLQLEQFIKKITTDDLIPSVTTVWTSCATCNTNDAIITHFNYNSDSMRQNVLSNHNGKRFVPYDLMKRPGLHSPGDNVLVHGQPTLGVILHRTPFRYSRGLFRCEFGFYWTLDLVRGQLVELPSRV